MRLEDEMKICKSKRVSGLPSSISFPSVETKDVTELVSLLIENGVAIHREDSERQISYNVSSEKKCSSVPLETKLERPDVKTIGYILRGDDGLEIHLNNYLRSQPDRPNMIGGPSSVTGGICCKFILEGDNTSYLSSRLQNIKTIIEEFYK